MSWTYLRLRRCRRRRYTRAAKVQMRSEAGCEGGYCIFPNGTGYRRRASLQGEYAAGKQCRQCELAAEPAWCVSVTGATMEGSSTAVLSG